MDSSSHQIARPTKTEAGRIIDYKNNQRQKRKFLRWCLLVYMNEHLGVYDFPFYFYIYPLCLYFFHMVLVFQASNIPSFSSLPSPLGTRLVKKNCLFNTRYDLFPSKFICASSFIYLFFFTSCFVCCILCSTWAVGLGFGGFATHVNGKKVDSNRRG